MTASVNQHPECADRPPTGPTVPATPVTPTRPVTPGSPETPETPETSAAPVTGGSGWRPSTHMYTCLVPAYRARHMRRASS